LENNYDIPLVVTSKSFSEEEWRKMKSIADQLSKPSNQKNGS
jgi:hypothetical protein